VRFGSPARSTSENLGIKRYVTAGDRAYEVGTLDGAFPNIGWHVKGHMNGVWTPPVKLLDSYRFLINGHQTAREIKEGVVGRDKIGLASLLPNSAIF
jgi:hypothetical protein